ncbi:vanadium-dependent haloperoxidase [Luteolibacter sp. GHJ8]|uniref:Vanadium-dependent haloperoxidase n=1 Tax=Luteolibacter rhizosphaerae TaxID=2989719 RepID=A0ABT3G2U9_9BACT|nr:vanadium-dependent haloperoxidase [Luteolibacter rhizosphaerae]MCW1914172.1 vanadium-dependent haloperoxidase [Luteolibacter rhizosphaerae]
MKSSRSISVVLAILGCSALSGLAAGAHSVARVWNEENLAAIRIDRPNPPVHARNLFHNAVAMYNAWAAYDTAAIGYIHHERAASADLVSARREAISYASYRILRARYAGSANAATTATVLDARLASLGYDKNFISTTGSSPAAAGNRIAASILAWGLTDGANQPNGYADPAYTNNQPEFRILENGVPLGGIPSSCDPDRWHPLTFDDGLSQNGVEPITLQRFVGVSWRGTRPFTLTRPVAGIPWLDPGPPARLRSPQAAQYKQEAIEVLERSRMLGDLTMIDISPGAIGNNSLGTEDGSGHPLNLATGQPYPPNLVPRGDYGRVLAEFWADGPDSETPPGHWHSIANEVSEQLEEKRIAGTGPVIDDLEWDVKLYFALAGAAHDAACAAWSLKRQYDSARPITMIRFMASQGQSSDPALPGFHPEGLPLVPGLVAVVTAESLASGGEHHGMGFAVGDIVIFTWPGRAEDPTSMRSMPRWIKGINWFPYQDRTFVTPAFPGYVSGHSTFSRASAEVLTAITGSEYFPGGLGSFTAPAQTYLRFEFGPSVAVPLQWATYFDAADEAGSSRRWGGIHPKMDDLPGRIIGSQCGKNVWKLVPRYWDGSIVESGMVPRIRRSGPHEVVLEWESVRGLWYRVMSTDDLLTWSPATAPFQATEPRSSWVDTEAEASRLFYKIVQSEAP